jgi:mRNA interferase YafQ
MKYTIVQTSQFKRDLKIAKRRGYDLSLLGRIVDTLAAGDELPKQNHDHPLKGRFVNCRECHITPDWLLVYEIVEHELFLYLTRTGTHSDLF